MATPCAREYVDEAENGLVADRPQFRKMIEEGSKPKAPFDVILVWKFSHLTRKRSTPSRSSPIPVAAHGQRLASAAATADAEAGQKDGETSVWVNT